MLPMSLVVMVMVSVQVVRHMSVPTTSSTPVPTTSSSPMPTTLAVQLYHVIQTMAYVVMATLIMRLKSFLTPQLSVVCGILPSLISSKVGRGGAWGEGDIVCSLSSPLVSVGGGCGYVQVY